MKKIIVIGAGAIGRGFLPWVMDSEIYQFVFVDISTLIIEKMKSGGYKTYMVEDGNLKSIYISRYAAYQFDEFDIKDHLDAEAVFMSVGPRNVESAAKSLIGTKIPCILCENDPESVDLVKNIVKHEMVFFAIPDVITSNIAPEHLMRKSPLGVITENGKLFIDKAFQGPLEKNIEYLGVDELLNKQWQAKLYLHNTAHCIAAYLGAFFGKKYLHEAMEMPYIDKVVSGAMNEMLEALKKQGLIPAEFLNWYADKELNRFREKLYDPISRVAREPLRKLDLSGRLIGAANFCISNAIEPVNLLTGIVCALNYKSDDGFDDQICDLLDSISIDLFGVYILRLRQGEPLEIMLKNCYEKTVAALELIRHRS